ncbi:unnamed protein product [Dracunculus medinensis]|uniref:SCP domain-containing protein n=1 Tax=Dracunculus medinensis TaxID=318479 RepID=A0A0N4UD51_DRAME|nr:unnamed protein product [Dracunculus medinensis]
MNSMNRASDYAYTSHNISVPTEEGIQTHYAAHNLDDFGFIECHSSGSNSSQGSSSGFESMKVCFVFNN